MRGKTVDQMQEETDSRPDARGNRIETVRKMQEGRGKMQEPWCNRGKTRILVREQAQNYTHVRRQSGNMSCHFAFFIRWLLIRRGWHAFALPFTFFAEKWQPIYRATSFIWGAKFVDIYRSIIHLHNHNFNLTGKAVIHVLFTIMKRKPRYKSWFARHMFGRHDICATIPIYELSFCQKPKFWFHK